MFRNLIYIIICAVIFSPTVVLGEMTSTNYHIYADSVGWDGGSFTTSTSFVLTDTFGETPVGYITSTSYELRGGFQAMDSGQISIIISTSTLDLGELSATAVSSVNTNVNITCDSPSGYLLTISSVGGSMPAAVAPGNSVVSGVESYGLAVSGIDSSLSGDNAVVTGLVLASSTQAVVNSVTNVTFKASISASTPNSTSYTQSIILMASANF